MNRSRFPRISCRARDAFTLTELLIVIALLATLLAVAIPMGLRVQRHSLTAKCLGNLRSFGTAVLAFHGDRGGFPKWDGLSAAQTVTGKSNWEEWLVPNYLPEIPRCPLKTAGDGTKGFYYAANSGLCIYFQKLKALPVPLSRVVLAKEASGKVEGFWSATHFNMTIWGNTSGVPGQNEGNAHTPQYHGSPEKRGIALFFLDGHCEVIASPTNDWKKGNDVYGAAKTGGYVYDRDQLGEMARGTWNLK